MKRLLTVLTVLLLLAPLGLRAQLDPVTLGLRAYTAHDFEKARQLFDLAITNDAHNMQARTWYFRGYTYKDLFKQNKDVNVETAIQQRSIALESFFKTILLDENEDFTADAIQVITFLANTLYNEAVESLDSNRFETSKSLYEDYRAASLKLNPEMDIISKDIAYMLYIASKYSLVFDQGDIDNKPVDIGENIVSTYNTVLQLDSNNNNANYNLGIHYYNQGVNIIENIDYNADFEVIFEKQAEVLDLFNSALPYMLKAHKLDPTRKEAIRGLSGIYYGLNDLEKSEFYQKKLEELEQGQ